MKNRGITLIALVITIIILIILASVTINLTLGENALFNKAKIAMETHKQEGAKEKIEIAIDELTIKKQMKPELSELNEITDEDIEIQETSDGNVEILTENERNYAVSKVDEFYFKIYDDMTVDFLRKESEEIKEREYVKDGLVVWYDGINNTREGHDSTTNTWENLVEDANNGTLKNIDFTASSGWTNNSLILDGANDWVQMSYLYYENMTVEIVAKPLDVDIEKLEGYISNFQNGGIGIRKNINNKFGGIFYTTEYKFIYPEDDMKIGQIYSMSTGNNGTEAYFRQNEQTYKQELEGKITKPEENTIFVIGTNPKGTGETLTDTEKRGNIEVYSVRIYNRCLTEEEVKNNYEVDKERFNIEELPEKEELGYVQDDLVCLYDGEQNTKHGHSPKTNIWQNLVGDTNNGTLKNINHNTSSGWTQNSLILDGVNDWGQMSYVNYANMTVEIVVKPLNIKAGYQENYLGNYQSGGIGISKYSNGRFSGIVYASQYNYLYSDEIPTIGKVYSMSTGYNGIEHYFRENDNLYKQELNKSYTGPTDSTIFAIGTDPKGTGENLTDTVKRANIEVYSVRIYNRCLSEEEIQENYLIDKQRFNIE